MADLLPVGKQVGDESSVEIKFGIIQRYPQRTRAHVDAMMAILLHNSLYNFLENIKAIVDLTGVNPEVTVRLEKRDNRKKKAHLSNSSFMNLYNFAVALNGRWQKIAEWEQAEQEDAAKICLVEHRRWLKEHYQMRCGSIKCKNRQKETDAEVQKSLFWIEKGLLFTPPYSEIFQYLFLLAFFQQKHVHDDGWFFSPSSIHAVKGIGYDVIAIVKKIPKMFFCYNGEDISLRTSRLLDF